MLRRALAALAVAVSCAVLVPASPAAAAGSCTLSVPAKVSVWHQFQSYTVRGSGACVVGDGLGVWSLTHPTQGAVDMAVVTAAEPTSAYDVYSWESMGRLTWRPEGAYDSNVDDLIQNAPVTEVRLGGWAAVTATRSGSKVTVSTRAVRYWAGGDKNIPWTAAAGLIQYRVPGTTTWRPLKNVLTGSGGTYSYTYTTTQVRDYRVVYNGTSAIWGTTTSTVRK